MPDLYLDFSWTHPPVDDLIRAGVRGILIYISPNPQGAFNTPPQSYLDECVARGIYVSPIFEQGGEQANGGYEVGRRDGENSVGWMERAGIPDGVRLYVNMADTPNSGGNLGAIRDYAAGFAETFPPRWQLGQYGNLGAIRVAQQGNPRFDKLWGVETWGAPAGSAEEHWQWWLGQDGVALVQMANIPPPIDGTDTNWLVPGRILDAWGEGALPPPTVHGFRYPLDPPIRVNSPWGPRDGGFHYGVDLWASNGMPCYAVADGTCFYAAFEASGGNHLAFYFDEPPTPQAPKFGYMHLDHFMVKPGDHVRAGDIVAYTDNTGASSGPHLHFWIGNNANVGAIDPMPFLYAGPPPPLQPPPSGDDMVIILQEDDFTVCWLMVGNIRIRDFVGPQGAYGIPQDALDYSNGGQIPIRRLHKLEMYLLDNVSKMLLAGSQPKQQPVSVSNGG